tara:strand:+ start:1135 stop:2382 length:1248 start_codon:yes stop_codon:yes gene_type:complete
MEQKIKLDFENSLKNSAFSDQEIRSKRNSLSNFLKIGYPNRKLENWKFSDISQIIKRSIGEVSYYNDYTTKNEIDETILIKDLEHNKIIIVNGKVIKFDFDYEDKDKIEITNVDQENVFHDKNNSLINLNNSFADKTYKIIIKKNYSLKKPLIIYQTTNKKVSNTNINFQLYFEIHENSSLRIVDMVDNKSEKNFVNIFYNFNLEKNAILKNYKLDTKISSNIKYVFDNITLSENSISEIFILSSGSNFSKNEIKCDLEGKYSSAFINGIHSLNNEEHHEIRTHINHLVENTKSYQLIKSVIDDSSKSVYQGKIYVDSTAQKTDGYQLSKAILLNENTEFNAKPELEIYADDVKCSHGSTSGNLDEGSIFYLMSRGLDYKTARELIINGFLLDVVEKITDEQIKKLVKNIIGLDQ